MLRAHLPDVELTREGDGIDLSAECALELDQARQWLAAHDLHLVTFAREELPLEQVLLEALRASRGEQR